MMAEQGKWQENRQREQETWTTQETNEGQVKLIRTIAREGRQDKTYTIKQEITATPKPQTITA